MKNKGKIFKNIFFGFGSKLITLVLGFVVPRLFIISFGSEINGLVSTVTQIFTYLALLEAGIGNSTVNALYGPITSNNKDEINCVLTQARKYYRKITIIYAMAVIAFAVVYPAIANSEVDYITILLIIFFQGIANCITYFFAAPYDQLLMADGKRYVTENSVFIVHIFTTVVRILLIYLGFNVVVVQGAYALLALLRLPITIVYCRHKYKFLDFHKEAKLNYLHERKAFLIHELSSTIFSNTDVFIVSTFCSFAYASVYTVYNLVFSALNSMVNMANAGLGFLLGENVHGDLEKLTKIYDVYSLLYAIIIFSIMTVAMIMIGPFVKLYTAGITDIDYMLPYLPELFTVIALFSGVRAVAARLITVSGHAKKTQNRSVIEMIINLSASLILVNICGIYGVFIGTIVALIYRTNDILIYANKKILKRTPWKEYKQIVYLTVVFLVFWLVYKFVAFSCASYLVFIIYGIVTFLVTIIVYFLVAIIFDKKKMFLIIKTLRNR